MVKRIGVKSIFILIGLEKAMAKYKSYDYAQRVMIPVSLEEQLVPGTLEFAIQTLVEDRMDMAVFEDRYQNDETGRLAYDPKILLKVVLLGYARGLITSRKMEQACRENVTFMALACGQRPEHSTIAGFVSSMGAEIVPLFRDVLLVCEESGLLGGTVYPGTFNYRPHDIRCSSSLYRHPLYRPDGDRRRGQTPPAPLTGHPCA
jgi:transposase